MKAAPQKPEYKLKSLSNGKTILFLMATAAEYLSDLKQLIDPVIIGVGPVEAAVNTGRILANVDRLPDYVILLGSAGSATLGQGEVYQANSIAYRDMDATALGFARGQTPFLEQPPVIDLNNTIPSLRQASLSTGASIILTKQFALIDEEMVDMESYAVLRVCQSYEVELIVLRGISDGPKELKVYQDWIELLPTVDKHLALAVKETLNYLENGND